VACSCPCGPPEQQTGAPMSACNSSSGCACLVAAPSPSPATHRSQSPS
jgi:hypothetical protein